MDAAAAAQRILELPVRMGIATGEAELREGDYFGAVLNRAARMMDAGHGGSDAPGIRAIDTILLAVIAILTALLTIWIDLG